jgi:hypothetical protein
MGAEKTKTDLLPGTLDMLVLKILMRGHLRGYAIAQRIHQSSGDLLRIEDHLAIGLARITGFTRSICKPIPGGSVLAAVYSIGCPRHVRTGR